MIGPKGQFFFLLAAVICFVLAAVGEPRAGRFGRPGLATRLAFVPLGLALWVFPTMWNMGRTAF